MEQSQLPFANDGSFFESFKKLQQQQQQQQPTDEAPLEQPQEQPLAEEPIQPETTDATDKADSTPSTSAAAVDESSADFIQALKFSGAREGFAFKLGDRGVGYYKDTPLHKVLTAPSKPVVLKTNKSIVKVPKKPVPGESKKRKADDDNSEAKPQYLKEMERYRAMSCSSDTKHDRPLVK